MIFTKKQLEFEKTPATNGHEVLPHYETRARTDRRLNENTPELLLSLETFHTQRTDHEKKTGRKTLRLFRLGSFFYYRGSS